MYLYSKKSSLSGDIKVPGSKSHTIRCVLMGMLSDGQTTIHNPLASRDGLAALNAAKLLGANVDIDNNNNLWIIHGLNGKPSTPDDVINTENSGTTTSFITGIASLLEGYAVITGDDQIRRRPWKAETDALRELGATCIHTRPDSASPPMLIGGMLKGGICHLPGINSQHVSGILVPSALLPEGRSVEILVDRPMETPYIQITLDWMKKFGVNVAASSDYKRFFIKGGQKYIACDCQIPADWSAVTFPLVAAVCTPSDITISGLNFFDSQGDKAVVDTLIRMGADIKKDTTNGILRVRGGKPLSGINIDMDLTPDSFPALCVAAAYAHGDTHFTNLAHIRIKETDRAAVMENLLNKCGVSVTSDEESMTVHGGSIVYGTFVSSFGDHRIAMSMAVMGLFSNNEMVVSGAECANVSFPEFYKLMEKLGANYVLKDE